MHFPFEHVDSTVGGPAKKIDVRDRAIRQCNVQGSFGPKKLDAELNSKRRLACRGWGTNVTRSSSSSVIGVVRDADPEADCEL